MDMCIDGLFPEGLRVQHKSSGKIGTVQKDFGGLAAGRFYDPWEVPVIWDGEEGLLGINYESLNRLV
jgi:hypothetical protein